MPTLHDLRAARTQHLEAVIAFLIAQSGFFQRFGPGAQRCLQDDDRRQLASLAQTVGWERITPYLTLTTVRTLQRWHRTLVVGAVPRTKSPGRPRTDPTTEAHVVRLAQENRWGNDAWGRKRIAGELAKLGILLSPSTVRAILRRRGIPTAPQRGAPRAGPAFVLGDPEHAVGMDFVQLPIATPVGWVWWFVVVAIDHASRRTAVIAATDQPDADFVLQVARDMTMPETGFLAQVGATHLVLDRDTKRTAACRATVAAAGTTVQRIPPRCPWWNGRVERVIRTLRTQVLSKLVVTQPTQLLELFAAYLEHYHHERPHQALGNRCPVPFHGPQPAGPIVCRPRLSGLINHYERTVA
jgi:putative transposase